MLQLANNVEKSENQQARQQSSNEVTSMDLQTKLQIPRGSKIRIIDCPDDIDLGLATLDRDSAGVLIFARDSSSLKSRGKIAIRAAKADQLSWIAYPKAGQLGTDLNRDKLSKLLEPEGVSPVRQVSIDGTWSALRFRPSKNR